MCSFIPACIHHQPRVVMFYYPTSLKDDMKEKYGALSTQHTAAAAFGAVDCTKAEDVCQEAKVVSILQ